MFKHSQLDSVKAWIAHPAHAVMPLHARIQRAIRQLIVDGALGAGKPLPASRALATSLGVSRDTIEAAYSQLHAEGFIDRRVGSGSFVAEMTEFMPSRPLSQRDALLRNQAPTLSTRGAAMFRSGGVREMLAPRPFAHGVPETRTFPLQLWERLERQVRKEVGAQTLFHGDPQGTEALRRAIADYVNLERGARATADRVLVLTSSQQAMSLCATMLLDPGDRIFLEDPAYYGARKAFDAAGLDCVPIPVDRQGIVVDQIMAEPHGAKAVFLTPSHQFPTGATLALDRRLALIEWAARTQAWIIEDDYDSEFHYAGKPTACVQGLDKHDRTLYIGTFTKSLFPGLRIGYVVLPPPLVKPMTVARTLLDGHTAPMAQLTLARFMEGGHFGAYVRTMRGVYAERLALLAGLVSKHLADFVEPRVPIGGLQLPCLLTRDLSERTAIDAARRVGIELLGLSALHAAGDGKAGFLMGFAAYTPLEIEEAVRKLEKALRAVTRP
ncbi:MocR-like pyridoxine biosynthesis transcription factor PdxR [Rhodospirillum rubrum]|uniref:Transcriptional regulator, GntR family n=1 Tax=Rhodospirillum rubrum (strain ATCC 11170 / ATH 1.1.1 / DSM 467 / LMG 4362 / NCIMB 8255 / S1) TaxID=269796 RepID=Q2RVA1_RHORT|nr:PLP-dependent aminotransferase family protein [Rhodospirillum rubrum]ABC21944.1 transcriptional regulator, GntR family [Rhodospirillum rubrum ATCC 11170]AEO47649.1 GntR family transcriptional regulator [Rhodospirillum rubrum F11]MBK5953510.1 PLP-dependent aminotransferase family protein [Rhodospirillum rubrum]QXG81599.1 PLP-dependent aminotransferase family protein [Rhodospirillum rubrum]HAP99517.1 PLP-dependent aminotransferase family protein [Rhodospirillum rubrum]